MAQFMFKHGQRSPLIPLSSHIQIQVLATAPISLTKHRFGEHFCMTLFTLAQEDLAPIILAIGLVPLGLWRKTLAKLKLGLYFLKPFPHVPSSDLKPWGVQPWLKAARQNFTSLRCKPASYTVSNTPCTCHSQNTVQISQPKQDPPHAFCWAWGSL